MQGKDFIFLFLCPTCGGEIPRRDYALDGVSLQMKNKGMMKRLLCWAVLSVMLLTAFPVMSALAEDFPRYGYILIPNETKNRVVNFRDRPGSTDYIDLLPEYWVVKVTGSVTFSGKLWYAVTAKPATFTSSTTRDGFIMASFVKLMTPAEEASYLLVSTDTYNPGGSSQPAQDEYSNYVVTVMDGVPGRAAIGGEALVSLPKDIVGNIIQAPAGNTENDWYYVERDGIYGYLQATHVRRLKVSELGNYDLPDPPAGSTDAPPAETPAPTGGDGDPLTGNISGYIKTNADMVNLRKTPGGTILTPTNAERIRKGTILAFTGIPTQQGGNDWVYVSFNGKLGYVRGDCYFYCDKDGNPVSVKPTAAPAPTAIPGQKFIKLIKGGVNVRKKPGGQTTGIQLGKNTILKIDGIEENVGDHTLWYHAYVPTLGSYGYILSTMAVMCDSNGNPTGEQPAPKPVPTPTGAPTLSGYIVTTLGSVNIRSAPKQGSSSHGQIPKKGTVIALAGSPVYNNPYTWYPIALDGGYAGYIRGDCATQIAQWQYDYYIAHGVCPTNSPAPATPKPGNSNYVITTDVKLWVRAQPSTKSSTKAQIMDAGTVIPFTESQKVGGVIWYHVQFNGEDGWIHGGFARVMTNAEYEAYIGTLPSPTPSPSPTPLPDPKLFSDLALTTTDKVKLRKEASMSSKELTMVYDKGSELTYLGKYTAPTGSNPHYWFNVRYGNLSGWMCGDFVRVLTQEEKSMYELAGNPDAPREATYRTVSKGDSGDDVKRLNETLTEKGYTAETDPARISTFTSKTENAVLAFQRAQKLTVDGIAGEKTQHALYGTVPTGTYSGGSVESIVYPVEMVDWFTGDIQQVWKVGVKAIVTDVYTGIAWRAQRIYGDKHADVEPATKEDTAAYCKVYKVQNPQEIADREQELQSYRRRPLWVTIGNRTFAASLYGEPHNFAGDMIPDNGFNGQVCIHFVNSRTHESDIVDYDRPINGNFGHQSAIKYAYKKYWDEHKE